MNVDTLVSPEQLVKEVLLGGNNVKVGNIQYHGDSAARGYFEVETSKLFVINKGLVLSTGLASSATGPNSTSHKSELLFTKGDSDLEMLCNEITHDAAVLEFDFVPTSNKISFQYIFASEEYLEFAGSKFNDVFGFFISGPAIKGQKNMAIMPNSDEIVAINSINQFKNTDYFINNNAWRLNGKIKSDVSLGMLDKDLLKTTEFDGMTIVLTAETNVIPFKKYHFKIAIADVNDRKYNSAVFLKGGSFKIVEDKTAPAEFLVNIDVDKERIDLDAILNAPTFHKNEFTPKGTSGELTLPIKKNIAKKNTSKKEIIFSEPNTRKKESKSVKNKLIGEEKIPENKVAEKPMLDEYTKMSIITQEKSIYFSTDSYQLSTEMKGYLNDLIQKIRGLNNASIGLLGHTDGIGNSDYNLLLSARRTQAVKAYLLKNGINSNQIKTEHFGELKPIESNSSSKGRQKNRRVEIRLTK
ncbi:MAG: choice-of-anchor L domain-containing protein [Saprospiraceae bacterium]